MNKIAVGLFSVLLLCGAFLWLLAPESYNQYIKQEIETTSTQVTQHQVSVEQAEIHAEQGVAKLTNLTITGSELFHLSPSLPLPKLLTVNNVNIALNPKTLNDSVIIINQLSLNGVTLYGAVDDVKQQLTNLLKQVVSNEGLSAPEPAHIEDKSANKTSSVHFMVKAIKVDDFHVHTPEKEVAFEGFSTTKSVDKTGNKTEFSQLLYMLVIEEILARL